MKRKLLLSFLAIVAAAFLPLAAASQLIHSRHGEAPAEKTEKTEKPVPAHKYEISAGYGYTSLNQVYQSRYGLQGVNASVTRDWGRFFGLTADGAYYWAPLRSKSPGNPGDPSVDAFFLGPVVHAKLFSHVDGLAHALLGGEHTGGENATPNISFAGGVGAGLDYNLSPHFSLRFTGDDIRSSFSANANSTSCGTGSNCTPHMHGNSRAAFSVVYKF
ncbi:MAG: hypothetical protein ABSC77_08185 [Terracidiphilus sp.]